MCILSTSLVPRLSKLDGGIRPKESLVKIACACANKHTELTCRNLHSSSMKLEFDFKSAYRIMVDLLCGDADHTVDTIQKRRVDGSQLLFFQHKIYTVARSTILLP